MINLKIELDGLKTSIIHQLEYHNQNIGDMIRKEIESQVTEEWVQDQIKDQVTQCISQVINSLTDDYRLRSLIRNAILDQIEGGNNES